MDFEKLAKILNEQFEIAGFPEDFLEFSGSEEVLMVRVGHRDVAIDSEGKIIGAGSNILLARRFEVVDHEAENRDLN